MHPLMTRFLDLTKVIELLERGAEDDDGRALVAAVEADGKLRAQVLAAKGKAVAPGELQQRVIVAATIAAAERTAQHATLGPLARAAIDAVLAAGGTREEGLSLVRQAVLDEAFGWLEDPEDFDQSFLAETLGALVPLAAIDTDAVEAWVDGFVKLAEAPKRPLRLAVAEALLEAAWSDGPQPIAAEHVDDALDALAATVASNELERAGEALVAFLTFLGEKGVVGPTRLARLSDVARASAKAPAEDDDEEDAEGDDEEE